MIVSVTQTLKDCFQSISMFVLTHPAAMSHLNGQKVFGKVMRVTLSKHQTVALPREGLDDQLLTKGNAWWHQQADGLHWCSRRLVLGIKWTNPIIPEK